MGCHQLIWDFKGFFKVVLNPKMAFPILFHFLLMLTPDLSSATNFVLSNVGKWRPAVISSIDLIYGVLYSITLAYTLSFFKKMRFGTILLAASATKAFSFIGIFSLYFFQKIPFVFQFVCQICFSLGSNLAQDLPLIAIIGKFGENSPEGFEGTGVSLLVSITIISLSCSAYGGGFELDKFGVRSGHYENLVFPAILNSFYVIFLVLVSPLFSCEGKKIRAKISRISKRESLIK